MKQPKYNVVADNCSKVAGSAAALTAGTLDYDAIAKGEVYPVNQNGDVITTAAIAKQTKSFRMLQYAASEVLTTQAIDVKNITTIKAIKPQLYKGNRLVIGKVTGITAENPSIVPGQSYAVGFRVADNMASVTNDRYFRGGATARMGTDIIGKLFVDLASSFYANKSDIDMVAAVGAHTNAASNGSFTGTITKGKVTGFIASGVPVVGEYIASQIVDAIDGRTQFRIAYRIIHVDLVRGTFELSQPWLSASIKVAATINKIAMVDTDEWAFTIQARQYVDTTEMLPRNFNTKLMYIIDPVYSHFVQNDIWTRGSELEGQMSIGHYLDVGYYQVASQMGDRDATYVDTTKEGYMYSSIIIGSKGHSGSTSGHNPIESPMLIMLERNTVAAEGAGTAAVYLSNILTGNGRVTAVEGSVVNAINLIAVEQGIFLDAANTINNGGNCLTPEVDF